MDTNRDVDYGFMIASIKYGATPIAIFWLDSPGTLFLWGKFHCVCNMFSSGFVNI